jgi:hypothetical protein
MTEHVIFKNDMEWFDWMCDILKKINHPTVRQLTELIGADRPNPGNEIRGSKFLVPFDKRFTWACINPDLSGIAQDRPVDFLAFGGENFNLKMVDIVNRFPNYRVQRNIYDGGSQIFFYPIGDGYEFSALDFWIKSEPEEIKNINGLMFHGVAFNFGDNLSLFRDGYHMKR